MNSSITTLINHLKSIMIKVNKIYKQKLDPTQIEKFEVKQKEKEALSEKQIEILKTELEQLKNLKHLKILILFLIENGCRIGEAVKVLNTGKFEFSEKNQIYFVKDSVSKNGNSRIFVMPKNLYENYQKDWRKILKETYTILINNFSKKLIKKYPENFKNPLTSHIFRTTLITNSLNSGKTLEQVADFLGSKNLEIIQKFYFKNNIENALKNALNIQKTAEKTDELILKLIEKVEKLNQEIADLKAEKLNKKLIKKNMIKKIINYFFLCYNIFSKKLKNKLFKSC